MNNRIYYPIDTPDRWEGMILYDVLVDEILGQADHNALHKLKKMDLTDVWVRHLFSLEKYEFEVREKGWRNPIVIYEGKTEQDWIDCPSGWAAEIEHKYIIAVGYSRHYWSARWGIKNIKAVLCQDSLEAHSFRSLSEAGRKIDTFGIKRIKGNLILPIKDIEETGLLKTGRFPQWHFPRFQIDPERIVERIRGKDWEELSGKYRVVRPMPGIRDHQSKFYQVSGEPPVKGEKFEAVIMPEGWISKDGDFEKYWAIFRNLK